VCICDKEDGADKLSFAPPPFKTFGFATGGGEKLRTDFLLLIFVIVSDCVVILLIVL